mmetsp:Transcript_99060/g.258243  ORF Transcript_99060/g.258243 Transcript_99060/m.258243 type:complete len:203 (+) Transcript_99060:171-779(+)
MTASANRQPAALRAPAHGSEAALEAREPGGPRAPQRALVYDGGGRGAPATAGHVFCRVRCSAPTLRPSATGGGCGAGRPPVVWAAGASIAPRPPQRAWDLLLRGRLPLEPTQARSVFPSSCAFPLFPAEPIRVFASSSESRLATLRAYSLTAPSPKEVSQHQNQLPSSLKSWNETFVASSHGALLHRLSENESKSSTRATPM